MQLRGIPVLAVLIWLVSGLALGTAIYCLVVGDERSARAFFWTALAGLALGAMLALALQRPAHRVTPREELASYLLAWLLVPVFAMLPLTLHGGLELSPGQMLFEMVADFTTTGGTAIRDLAGTPDAIHLWRGLVGWSGGFVILMAAHVVLAPRNLGGAEVRGAGIAVGPGAALGAGAATPEQRFARAWRMIGPVYLALTGIAIFALSLAGQPPLDATIHGMALLSTSGISPHPGGLAAGSTRLAEAAALLFLLLAAIRLTFDPSRQAFERRAWLHDPEIKLLLGFIGLATLVLFLRHFLGVIGESRIGETGDGWRALWGALFTSASFATTTGFFSADWASVRWWSGLENPGLVLLALAALGGGAATTAGGVKLIRVHALSAQCARELTRLAQPRAVPRLGPDPGGNPAASAGQADTEARGARRDGALIAWTFAMLFLGVTVLATLALTLSGLAFDSALVAALSGLSNTGPAFGAVINDVAGYHALDAVQRWLLMATMILGRVETLALIALFNPDRWR